MIIIILFVNNRAIEDGKYNFIFCVLLTEPIVIVNTVLLTHCGRFFIERINIIYGLEYQCILIFFSLDDRDKNYILYNGDLDDTIILCIHPKQNSHTN